MNNHRSTNQQIEHILTEYTERELLAGLEALNSFDVSADYRPTHI